MYIYMYIRKRSDSETDPCGTSQFITSASEKTSSSVNFFV